MRLIIVSLTIFCMLTTCLMGCDKPSDHVTRIVLSSLGCFGYCPVMKVDIQENGSFHFQGERYTDKIGFYKAANQQAAFAELQDKLRGFDLETLRESYTVFQTDLEAYLLKIYHDNKFVATQVYGHDPEPAQIMALIASLEKLYKSIPIQYGWPRFRYQRPQRSRAYPFPATRRQR